MRASYGDSFTYADEVEDGEAWGNVLSERMACRVANFGVGGYGTDQAFLRFRAQNGARARVAILGIFPFDLMRNVNQFRYCLASSNHFGLKPRFVQHEDGLHLVALPTVSYEGYLASLRDPGDFYPHETFIPDTELGPISLGFPFTSVAVRYFLSARLQNYLRGRPSWIDFFAADHSSGALLVTAEIGASFAELARARGMHPMVLIFSTPASLEYLQSTGRLATQPLLGALESRGVDYLELHQPVLEVLGSRSFCELLTEPEECHGHFNAEGNGLVAAIVHRHLEELGLGGP